MSAPRLGVPWYVHPAEDPEAWRQLRALAPVLDFVVVNVDDGPGDPDDPYYPGALARLAGIELLGYVDVAYGSRPIQEVVAEVRQWMGTAGLRGIMFDQVPSSGRSLARLARLADAARRLGAARVVANPGVVPTPDLLEIFDVTCVFEGDASAYEAFVPPRWLRAVPRARVWHLVHTCPTPGIGPTFDRVAANGAGLSWVTDGMLPNPWDHVPTAVRAGLRPVGRSERSRDPGPPAGGRCSPPRTG